MIAAVTIGVIVAVVTLFAGGSSYDRIGKWMFSRDDPDRPRGPAPGCAAADAEARAEIRQLVVARNERRLRQGKEPLDVESEVDRQLRELG